MNKYIIYISKFNNNLKRPGFKNKRLEVWDTSIILARDKALDWFPGYQCNMIWPE
jgi:hypothetical protein